MEWISGCWPDSLGKPFLKKSERPHVVSIPSDRCVSGGLNDWGIFSERAPPASCTKTWSINIGWVSLPGNIINTHVWWIWQCWLETWRSRESCRRSQCVKPKNTYLSMGFLNPSQHLFSFFLWDRCAYSEFFVRLEHIEWKNLFRREIVSTIVIMIFAILASSV